MNQKGGQALSKSKRKKGGKPHKFQTGTLEALVSLTAAIVNLITALILLRIALDG